jgi:hypothetical protein
MSQVDATLSATLKLIAQVEAIKPEAESGREAETQREQSACEAATCSLRMTID